MTRKMEYILAKTKSVVLSTEDEELLAETIDFVLSQTISLVQEDIKYKRPVLKILRLANTDEFRNISRLLVHALCKEGEWAYPGGRTRKISKIDQHVVTHNAAKKESSKRMQLIKLDVQPFDLVFEAWKRIIHDIRVGDSKSRTLRVNTPYSLIEVFYRKMENHMKSLAQKEAGIWSDKSVSEPLESISADDVVDETNKNNIFYLQSDALVEKQKHIERINEVLSNHSEHLETIQRMTAEGLRPIEESEKYDISVDEINRRRDAAMKYIRRQLNDQEG